MRDLKKKYFRKNVLMGVFYIITDRNRLHQSIFKIGKTQNENLRSLETRYRNTIKEPILLGFIEVGPNYEIIERTLLNTFVGQRINHGGKGESEWVQMPYHILVLAVKYVIVHTGLAVSVTAFSVPGIVPEHYVVANLSEIQKKTLAELNVIPPFFEHRLVNHTQTLETFEPDIFGCELLFIPYQYWPNKMKEYYTIFRPSTPPVVILDPRNFTAGTGGTGGPSGVGGILTTIKSYFSYMTTVDPDLESIKNTFLGDKRIVDAYLYLITKNDTKNDKLKPYRDSFDIFVDYLLEKFGSAEKIVYTTINMDFLQKFLDTFYSVSNAAPKKSYTYVAKMTCKHVMISGKNKGKYCNTFVPLNKDTCVKHG